MLYVSDKQAEERPVISSSEMEMSNSKHKDGKEWADETLKARQELVKFHLIQELQFHGDMLVVHIFYHEAEGVHHIGRTEIRLAQT